MPENVDLSKNDEQLIFVRKFYNQSQAELYAARLREQGIQHFLTNRHMNSMLHMATSEIGIQILKKDLSTVEGLFAALDELNAVEPEQSFHDADLDDIYYEKSLNDAKKGHFSLGLTLIVIILIMLILMFNYYKL